MSELPPLRFTAAHKAAALAAGELHNKRFGYRWPLPSEHLAGGPPVL